MNDRPLAALRGDMQRFGIGHGKLNNEPEDHIAFLFEMMHGLIVGSFGAGTVGIDGQRAFFDSHISEWAADFFEDLRSSPSAQFYAAIAQVGLAFVQIEAGAFEMAA